MLIGLGMSVALLVIDISWLRLDRAQRVLMIYYIVFSSGLFLKVQLLRVHLPEGSNFTSGLLVA